ncbi:MAG: TetR family transcriptional regulator [Kineosporiaceae bacterium]|nr:TetR family transcriptional regulator [Aeromicrobium sp.]
MRYHRTDIVQYAIGVLDQYGLADLSMRRIAAELGVQPSALYHHFVNKQALLAAVADEILARGGRSVEPDSAWDKQILSECRVLRNAMLAYRDGAELISTVRAFGLGVRVPHGELAETIRSAGFDDSFSRAAATTILHFVFGQVSYEQLSLQAHSDGAIDSSVDLPAGDAAYEFSLGLMLIVDGIRMRQPSYER